MQLSESETIYTQQALLWGQGEQTTHITSLIQYLLPLR